MKKLFSFLVTCMIASYALAQVNSGTVSVSVTGNRNKQITVDGKLYTINNTNANSEQDVVINNLAIGQHALQVIRTNPNSNKKSTTNTSFTLRSGYDLDIRINGNGAVTMTEKRTGRNDGAAISTNAFNKIYTATQKKTSSSLRASFLENEFVNTGKLFTSSQVSQLIKLVNTESLRLSLAKNAYTRVTDRQNYAVVTNLLLSSVNRTSLNNYIATVPIPDEDEDEDMDDFGDANTPMSEERFNAIYKEVFGEYSATDKNYYLTNFFTKDFNFYSSTQVRQLIQLIPTETERFNLAKLAYRGTTDKENYNQVVQLLSSSYNRSQLSTYLASYDGSNPVLAMNANAFNQLYQNVSYQTSTSGRYTAINNAFTGNGNYFTAAQARQLIQLVNNEGNRLMLAKTSYKVLVDRDNYIVLNDLLSSQTSRNDLADYVYSYNNYGTGTGSGVAMTDAEFNSLYNSVSGNWSGTTRYSQLNSAFQNSNAYYTTTQVRKLLLLLNNESERMSLAKMSYDNLVDQQNYAVMSDLFANSANRNEWTRYANENRTGGGGVYVKTPMTDSEFSSVYRNIQFTFGIGAKMNGLTQLFNTETNFFTVQQTKQLIQLVSSESNRLELAKGAYNNLTDPANYTELLSLFSSQASKDEFTAYVGSNAYLDR